MEVSAVECLSTESVLHQPVFVSEAIRPVPGRKLAGGDQAACILIAALQQICRQNAFREIVVIRRPLERLLEQSKLFIELPRPCVQVTQIIQRANMRGIQLDGTLQFSGSFLEPRTLLGVCQA